LFPDSYPKFASNIKSNSQGYLNYSSLCVDSVNAELIFCFKLHKLLAFSGWYWPVLNISWLIFLNPIPLESQELVMYACFGLIRLPHTESTRSETFRQLSQHWVRLHVKWVNVEWDSTSTESTQKAPTFTHISSFCVDSVDMVSHSPLTQLT
jgi:hypothetical protein